MIGLFALIATLSRIATGGAPVAVVLLANDAGLGGKGAGMLAACLTAPHLLGPLYGQWLDRTSDARRLIALMGMLFTACFTTAVWGFTNEYTVVITLALLGCGVSSSFLMGGLSSQLKMWLEDDVGVLRQAQSWDTVTYGIALTLGPLFIATASEAMSLSVSAILLACLPTLSALLLFLLPKKQQAEPAVSRARTGIANTVAAFVNSVPLKQTITITSCAAFAVAVLPVLAVFASERWYGSAQGGALLMTAYGVGCICGATVLVRWPLAGTADTLLIKYGSVLLLSLVFVGFTQSFHVAVAAYWLCGVVNSVFFATTLAARSEFAPPDCASQVYMWVASAKIGAASVGTLLSGVLIDVALSLPVMVGVSVLFTSLMLSIRLRKAA